MKERLRTCISAVAVLCAVGAWAAGGSVAEKPRGFRFFNNRLIVKPYVSFAYTFDSNIDSTEKADHDNIFMVSPTVDFQWSGERWLLTGSVWYRHNHYCEFSDEMGENSYGESLVYKWTTSKSDAKGWSALVRQQYAYITQSDDMTQGGRGIWRDRETVNISGAIERRFNNRLHADISAQYNYLDYTNDDRRYAWLYGWSQYSVGFETGYMASKWTDVLVSLGYHYNDSFEYEDSKSYSVMGGFGTRATEKIQYRFLLGASWLDYSGVSTSTEAGWTYELSGNWRITRQWQLSVKGSSYYQPSERTYGSAIKVSSLSAGVSYLTLGDRMTLTANVAFRMEENASYLSRSSNYDAPFISGRLGATYTLNRWVSLYSHLIWEKEWNDISYYDYDRFRATLGVRFHY